MLRANALFAATLRVILAVAVVVLRTVVIRLVITRAVVSATVVTAAVVTVVATSRLAPFAFRLRSELLHLCVLVGDHLVGVLQLALELRRGDFRVALLLAVASACGSAWEMRRRCARLRQATRGRLRHSPRRRKGL
jgi:hypothetical protein